MVLCRKPTFPSTHRLLPPLCVSGALRHLSSLHVCIPFLYYTSMGMAISLGTSLQRLPPWSWWGGRQRMLVHCLHGQRQCWRVGLGSGWAAYGQISSASDRGAALPGGITPWLGLKVSFKELRLGIGMLGAQSYPAGGQWGATSPLILLISYFLALVPFPEPSGMNDTLLLG